MKGMRALREKPGAFTTLIPLKFRNGGKERSKTAERGIIEALKLYAVARLYMDNFPHLKAYWPMLGRQNAQLTLSFGVNDLDGTIDDTTKIYSMAGSEEETPTLATAEVVSPMKHEGGEPGERDTLHY